MTKLLLFLKKSVEPAYTLSEIKQMCLQYDKDYGFCPHRSLAGLAVWEFISKSDLKAQDWLEEMKND